MPTPDTLKTRQAVLKQGYRDDPGSARLTSAVDSTTTPGDDPTRVRITVDSPAHTALEIAAHAAVGGEGDLPCSGDIFLASLAACQEITFRMVASAMGLALNHLAVRVEGDWDVRGTLAISRDAPIGFTAIRVLVDLDVDATDEQRARLLTSAERYCVVSQTLKNPPPVELVVRDAGVTRG